MSIRIRFHGGIASEPREDEGEAYRIINLVPRRDAIIAMNRFVETLSGVFLNNEVQHVSNHPDGTIMALSDGALHKVSLDSPTYVEVEPSGWPETHVKPCEIVDGAGFYWLCPKTSYNGTDSDVYAVDQDGSIQALSVPTEGSMMATLNGLAFLGSYGTNALSWCSDGNPLDWPAANSITLQRIGKLQALVPMLDSQLLAVGHQGASIVSAPDSNSIAQQSYSNIGTIFGSTVTKCGDHGVAWVASDYRVMLMRGNLEQIELPINTDLKASSPSYGSYDAFHGWYCLANASQTFLFDFTRNRWIGTLSRKLASVAYSDASGGAGQNPIYSNVSNLLSIDSFFDDSDTCSVEIVSPPRFSYESQLQRIWLDADGDEWVVTLYGRDSESASWVQLWTDQWYAAPCWIYPARHLYRQRKLVFSHAASSVVVLREIVLSEQKKRIPRA